MPTGFPECAIIGAGLAIIPAGVLGFAGMPLAGDGVMGLVMIEGAGVVGGEGIVVMWMEVEGVEGGGAKED